MTVSPILPFDAEKSSFELNRGGTKYSVTVEKKKDVYKRQFRRRGFRFLRSRIRSHRDRGSRSYPHRIR